MELWSPGDFKPEFRDGRGRVNRDLVWSRSVAIATKHGLQFVPNTNPFLLVSAPKIVATGRHGILYEIVTLQLKTPSRMRDVVEVYVGAEVLRKSAVSMKRAVRVSVECDVKTFDTEIFGCLDLAIVEEMVDVFLVRQRGI